jgi:hypothetical protein
MLACEADTKWDQRHSTNEDAGNEHGAEFANSEPVLQDVRDSGSE